MSPAEPLSTRLSRVISWREDFAYDAADEHLVELLRECLHVVEEYEKIRALKP